MAILRNIFLEVCMPSSVSPTKTARLPHPFMSTARVGHRGEVAQSALVRTPPRVPHPLFDLRCRLFALCHGRCSLKYARIMLASPRPCGPRPREGPGEAPGPALRPPAAIKGHKVPRDLAEW